MLLGDYSDTSASSPPWVALRRAVLLYWGAGQWSLTKDRSDRLIARAGSRDSATACAYVYGSFTWELRVSLFLLRRTWEEGELGNLGSWERKREAFQTGPHRRSAGQPIDTSRVLPSEPSRDSD